jgi:hypothetical protein
LSSSCVPHVAGFSGLFLFCLSSSCVPHVASFSILFLFCLSSSCVKTKTIQRNWQHGVHKTNKNKTKTIQRNWQHGVHKTKTNKEKQSRETGNMGYTIRRQTKRLVYPMLPVSLDCFCFVFLRLVYPMLPVSLDCFCFVCLRLVYPMLPVSVHKTQDEDKQNKGQSSIDDLETLATLGTQDSGRRQTKQGAIKNRRSRDTGNIGYTRGRTKTNKTAPCFVCLRPVSCVPNVTSVSR